MEPRGKAIIAGGLVLCAALAIFIDIYVAAIVFVTLLALAIAFQIMDETRSLPPRLSCWLSEDAKKIIVANKGNDRAVRIHVTLVPLNQEFDLPELSPEERHEFPLPGMITEAKAVVSYEDPSGGKYSRSFPLSSTDRGEDDLLKPVFPVFGWK
jgi:hypothetical protein